MVSVLPVLVLGFLGYLIVLTSSGWAQLPLVNIETVLVGDLGNASDTTGHGAVAHEYEIGKYEVTIRQYVTFLNSVAAVTTTATTNSNPHLLNLWHTSMDGSSHSSGISRSGSGTVSDPYVYAPIGSDRQPIYSVSWFDAARFCNWVHNGATNGADTETGAYTLNEAISGLISKNPNAKWWIPTEDEWYKAAYYEGATLQNYWLYPTRSNDEPGNVEGGDTNQASYGKNTLSDVGAYTGSSSFYGTFDQAGNVWEWTDSLNPGPRYPDGRTVRGGSYDNPSFALKSSWVSADAVGNEWTYLGFRVATIGPSSDLDNDGVTYYRETADGTNPNDPNSFNPLSKGLVAYYPFDGNATDVSGYSNHGTASQAVATTDRYGTPNSAYAFDGNTSFVLVPNSEALSSFGDEMSVSCWALFLEPGSGEWRGLISKYRATTDTPDNGFLLRTATTSIGAVRPGVLFAELGGVQSAAPAYQKDFAGSQPTWMQIVAVSKDGKTTLYLDGKEVATGLTAGAYNNSDQLTIGGQNGSYLNRLHCGSLDEVRIYRRALSVSEVAQLFVNDTGCLDLNSNGLVDAADFIISFGQAQLESGQTSVTSNPSTFNLFTQADYESFGALQFSNGASSVLTNPSSFNLFTQEEFDDNRTAGQSDVMNNPMTYGLYTSDSIMDLRMGGLMIQRQGTNAVVSFQPQTTTDLTQPFTNNGTPITHEIPMPGNKGFIRINAKP